MAGMWSVQSIYLRDATHRHLDTFSVGPVVAALQVMSPTTPSGFCVVTIGIDLCAAMVPATPGSQCPLCCDVSTSSAASSLLSSTFN